jgi:alpha-glucosidase
MAGRPWWVDATVYQIYVRSFADANGDGRGDLVGIIDRLDHLVDLGVDAIWMTPCYPSPQLDHGYDVADYFDIEPTYGDLATFDRLVATCRDRGLRVLMDVVPNHCSDHHPWFVDALRSPSGSHERSRFYFRDGKGQHGELPPNNWRAIFGGPAWSRTIDPNGTPGQWYLHTFSPWQPDFDWDSPDVVAHFDSMLRFWFDRGVEGFRVDAVTVLGKAPGLPDAPELPAGVSEADAAHHNPYTLFWPSAHDVWRHWRALIEDYQREHPGRQLVAVGEAYTPRRPDLLLDYVRLDEFHQSFCFDLMLCPWDAVLVRQTIDSVYGPHVAAGAALTWTLNNHDVQRSVTRYGRADATSPDSWTGNNLIYTGTQVDLVLGTRRARAMIAFVAGLPGALYLYQGEELGLPEVLDLPLDRRQDPIVMRTEGHVLGRDGCRVPLPWSDDPTTSFGFSEGAGPVHEPWLPQPIGWGMYALDHQQHEPSSMMSLYRKVLSHRRALDVTSSLEWLTQPDEAVLAFRRASVTIVLNPSDTAIELPAALTRGKQVAVSSVHGHDDPHVVPAAACLWLVDRL